MPGIGGFNMGECQYGFEPYHHMTNWEGMWNQFDFKTEQ